MKTEYCPDYVGVACVDGTCPVANCEEYVEWCMPVISSCRNCFYYKDCEDCAISDDCDRMEDKHVDYAVKKEVYNWDGVERVVTEALAHGNKVVINADW